MCFDLSFHYSYWGHADRCQLQRHSGESRVLGVRFLAVRGLLVLDQTVATTSPLCEPRLGDTGGTAGWVGYRPAAHQELLVSHHERERKVYPVQCRLFPNTGRFDALVFLCIAPCRFVSLILSVFVWRGMWVKRCLAIVVSRPPSPYGLWILLFYLGFYVCLSQAVASTAPGRFTFHFQGCRHFQSRLGLERADLLRKH